MTIDASKLEQWAEALWVAKNGLEWYSNEFPETYSPRDDEVHAQIDAAIESLNAELSAAHGEVMVNGLTETETSASASVAGLTLKVPDGWSIERSGNGDVITSVSPDGVRWYVLKDNDINERREKIGAHFYQLLSDMLDARARDANAASAEDMKVYDSIAAGYRRSTAGAIDPGKMRGPCGMATSQHEGRRRITLEFDIPEDAVGAHSALIGMGWPQRSLRISDASFGSGRAISPEVVNQIAAQAGFGPAAAWPEFSGTMQRFFSIAFKMGVQDAMSCRAAARARGEL